MRDVNLSVRLIGMLATFAKDAHQESLTNKLNAQYKDYATKFAAILNTQQSKTFPLRRVSWIEPCGEGILPLLSHLLGTEMDIGLRPRVSS